MTRPPSSIRLPAPRLLAALACLLLAAGGGRADPIDQARRIHDRLVGVPPSQETLDEMVVLMSTDPVLAAERAMEEHAFYNVVLKNFVTPWTNVERTVFAPLNDYTATVIGMIRDDADFREVLQADVVYVGAPFPASASTIPYSHTDNSHYEQLEANRVDLGDPTQLVSMQQSALPDSPFSSADTAGIITTRQAGMAFFSAGTNRRMWRFLGMNYLCRDLEQLKDVSREADRIRQDVTRSPGGDSELFHTQCVGCHSGMDPLAGAFAYYQWNDMTGRTEFTPGFVQPKFLINSNAFTGGYITVDDRWDNFWRGGVNAALGWRGPISGGYGAKSLGQEVAMSWAFSVCQVEKVFQHVCFSPPRDAAEVQVVRDIATAFEADNWNMKTVFARVAVHCMGD